MTGHQVEVLLADPAALVRLAQALAICAKSSFGRLVSTAILPRQRQAAILFSGLFVMNCLDHLGDLKGGHSPVASRANKTPVNSEQASPVLRLSGAGGQDHGLSISVANHGHRRAFHPACCRGDRDHR